MQTWDEQLATATAAWQGFCRALETTGTQALAKTLTHDEVDLAEGLRHLARMAALTLVGSLENKDSRHPYLWPALDPHRKMGGDNPQGLYLSGPVNGVDTFRLRGTRGQPDGYRSSWGRLARRRMAMRSSCPTWRSPRTARSKCSSPRSASQGIGCASTASSNSLLVRQFYPTPDDVEPMVLTLENLTNDEEVPSRIALDAVVAGIGRATGMYTVMLAMMQGELLGKGAAKNSFKTDIADPTSTSGGVPGGNAVTARWALEPSEALVVQVTPPDPCAYWDVQVGNGWYESFDYRHRFCGLTCEGAHLGDDGSLTLVVSDRDPGVANWLEAAGHREGHIAIRWQLTEGNLPIPQTRVVNVHDVAALTGLPPVSPRERSRQRKLLAGSFDARFRL